MKLNKPACAATGLLAALCIAGAGMTADKAGNALPRLPDGKPDLSGTWDNGGGIDFVRPEKLADGSVCVRDCTRGGPPPPRVAPDRPKYRAEFLTKVKELDDKQVQYDNALRCEPPGVPRIGPPDKIVQTRREVIFLYEDVSGGFFRIVPIDGRPHRSDNSDTYLGDAIGHWEGDTLVVESSNFNDETWLTDDGTFHTTGLKVTERLTPKGATIEYQAIADDPKVLAEPWKLRGRVLTRSEVELAEPAPCLERDLSHVVDGTHHDNTR